MEKKTTQENLKANVDWLQFRIDDIKLDDIVKFLETPLEMFLKSNGYPAGYKHYSILYEFQNIKIYFGMYQDNFNLTHESYMIQISGSACRYIENVTFKKKGYHDWHDFLKNLLVHFNQLETTIDFKRIDLNIDDFNKLPYFTPSKLLKFCEKNSFKYGRSRKYSVQGTEKTGLTLYLGASKSDRRIRIYDKKKEQHKKEIEVPYGSWIRTEIQFMRVLSSEIVHQFVNTDRSLIDFTKGYLKKQLHFYTNPNLKMETRIWTRFLGSSEPFKLTLNHEQNSMQEKIEWFKNGGGLAILKAYVLLHDNNILPEKLSSEDKEGIEVLIESKDFPLELSKALIDHISIQEIDISLQRELIDYVKAKTYDPFEREKIKKIQRKLE